MHFTRMSSSFLRSVIVLTKLHTGPLAAPLPFFQLPGERPLCSGPQTSENGVFPLTHLCHKVPSADLISVDDIVTLSIIQSWDPEVVFSEDALARDTDCMLTISAWALPLAVSAPAPSTHTLAHNLIAYFITTMSRSTELQIPQLIPPRDRYL